MAPDERLVSLLLCLKRSDFPSGVSDLIVARSEFGDDRRAHEMECSECNKTNTFKSSCDVCGGDAVCRGCIHVCHVCDDFQFCTDCEDDMETCFTCARTTCPACLVEWDDGDKLCELCNEDVEVETWDDELESYGEYYDEEFPL